MSPQAIDTLDGSVRHPIRRRLWKGAIAVAAVLLVFIVAGVSDRVRHPSPTLTFGHDLIPSYAAGELVREGRPRAMYDREALSTVEFRMKRDANLAIDDRFYGAWLNPPFYAWVFAPLSVLPYRQAAVVFLVFNLILFGICLALLARLLVQRNPGDAALARDQHADWRTLGLVPLLVVLPLPLWQVMGHQQNTFISLSLLLISVGCWRAGMSFTVGAVGGLLFFKPQLAAVFAAVAVLCLGWRALAGFAVTGLILLAVTLVSMPGCLTDYFVRLPPILHWLQMESPYNWGRQVTFQSFWRLLIQGQVRGDTILAVKVLWWLSSGLFVIAMGFAVRYQLGSRSAISRDRLIAAAVASMPVLMPYYMDYDLLLLSVPLALLSAEWIRHPTAITRADRWLLAAWIIFCVETHFNPGVAGGSRINPAVPLLAVISVLHIARCFRPASTADAASVSDNPPFAPAA